MNLQYHSARHIQGLVVAANPQGWFLRVVAPLLAEWNVPFVCSSCSFAVLAECSLMHRRGQFVLWVDQDCLACETAAFLQAVGRTRPAAVFMLCGRYALASPGVLSGTDMSWFFETDLRILKDRMHGWWTSRPRSELEGITKRNTHRIHATNAKRDLQTTASLSQAETEALLVGSGRQ